MSAVESGRARLKADAKKRFEAVWDRLANVKEGEQVAVRWLDHYVFSNRRLSSLNPHPRLSYGVFVRVTHDDYVVLVQGRDEVLELFDGIAIRLVDIVDIRKVGSSSLLPSVDQQLI